MKRLALALSVLLLVVSALSGCGGTKETAPKTDSAQTSDAPKKISGKLMIYTSIYPDIIKQVEPELKKAFPDLTIEWFQSGTEKVVAKLAGEIEAGKVGADLLMVADPSYYLFLKDKNLLMSYKPKDFDKVAVDKDEKDFTFAGVRISNVVLAYNTKLVKADEAPKSFSELLDPKWKGQVVIVDPTQSGTALNSTYALSKKYGWEYFEKLKANGAVVGGGNSSVEKKLVSGEFKVAMILEENILKVKAKGEPVDLIYPADGVIIIPSPIGIFKSTQNPDAAKAVTDWWLSKTGQEAVVAGWMHAVRTDVAAPKGAKPLADFNKGSIKVDWVDLSKTMGEVKDKFVQIMGSK
ncbi:MAG: ABC transporter substrate-binding protein [Bacillota bacterium]